MNEDRLASAICGALLTLGLAIAAAIGFWSAPSLVLLLAFLCASLGLLAGWIANGLMSDGRDAVIPALACIVVNLASAGFLAYAMIERLS